MEKVFNVNTIVKGRNKKLISLPENKLKTHFKICTTIFRFNIQRTIKKKRSKLQGNNTIKYFIIQIKITLAFNTTVPE